ncbi:hypothetical protein TNCV_2410171 [Trichonephila clavipes]|nr:hypothetical protein TNCV_2410171 [Trichonephila clavipes]
METDKCCLKTPGNNPHNPGATTATRGLLARDFVILNHGQVTKTTSEQYGNACCHVERSERDWYNDKPTRLVCPQARSKSYSRPLGRELDGRNKRCSNGPKWVKELSCLLQAEWKKIPLSIIQALVESMSRHYGCGKHYNCNCLRWHGHREERKDGEKEEKRRKERNGQQDGGVREHGRMSGIVITLRRIETKWR